MIKREYESSLLEARKLASEGVLALRWHPRLEQAPPTIPAGFDLKDRVEGMMLGLAIGDALGNTTESLVPVRRLDRYGWIADYLPNRHNAGARVGLPSDDSQLAFWTLEHLVSVPRLDPNLLAQAFSDRQIFGIGRSVSQFMRNTRDGVSWRNAGAASAGDGALMRIAPVVIPHLTKPSPELWGDTVLAAHLTHRDACSNAACLAFVDLLWHLISRDTSPDPMWWLEHFATACTDVEPDTQYQPRSKHPPGFSGTLSEMVRQYAMPALEKDLPVDVACEIWHSGAYLLETVPSVLYILARHGHDPEMAILQAVNHTKDNDTVAAIVGAAVGALHGLSRIPRRWLDGLSGRTTDCDDGRRAHS